MVSAVVKGRARGYRRRDLCIGQVADGHNLKGLYSKGWAGQSEGVMKYPVASLPPQASEGEKKGWLQESRTGESTEIGLTYRAESFT